MEAGIGTAAGAKDIRTNSRSPACGIQKERVIVPLGRRASALDGWGFPVPTLRYLMALPVYLLSKAE